jgi:hypothetical protein
VTKTFPSTQPIKAKIRELYFDQDKVSVEILSILANVNVYNCTVTRLAAYVFGVEFEAAYWKREPVTKALAKLTKLKLITSSRISLCNHYQLATDVKQAHEELKAAMSL